MKDIVYPMSAIVGQEAAKRALLLALVNPRAGGLLLSGAQGTAKTLLVRAAGALPQVGKLTQLPLGATDDMVFGGTDIERLLADGVRTAQPGILRRAAGGLLLLDEANLLPRPFLHAALAAAEEDASVVLVGTMNPEEGDIRPQLLDRFALSVTVAGEREAETRVEVIRRRIAYERDPDAFAEMYAAEQKHLRTQILEARARVPGVTVPDAVLDYAAQISLTLGVDGHRADITLIKAGIAHAALAGRSAVTAEDLQRVSRLVLAHRMRRRPFEEGAVDWTAVDAILGESA